MKRWTEREEHLLSMIIALVLGMVVVFGTEALGYPLWVALIGCVIAGWFLPSRIARAYIRHLERRDK